MTNRARVIIGANFGDEGKGLMTDYLCSKGTGVVIRFNGGAQAGHTVVTPDGDRHVFSHVGSGAFLNIPTFLSQFFIINPLLFLKELESLAKLNIYPTVYAHPSCLVTTFADMIINQRIEDGRGKDRHGSVGVGINETFERSNLSHLKITMGDIWNGKNLKSILVEICNKYAEFRTRDKIHNAENMVEAFEKACTQIADLIHPAGISQCITLDPIFEGAQGLLLSQDNKENFPYVTRSFTGMKNVRILCKQANITNIEAYYVSRTYLTKHGAGPLIGEDPNLKYEDDTNLDHNHQGSLRFAEINYDKLLERCYNDYGSSDFNLVLTHCDQEKPKIKGDFLSWGSQRKYVEKIR